MGKKDLEIESLNLRIKRTREACLSGIQTYTDNIEIVEANNHPKEWVEEFREKRAIYKEILEIIDPETFYKHLRSSSNVKEVER